MANIAFCVSLTIEMIKVRPAGLAGVVNVFVAIGCNKAVAFELWALAYYTSTATGYQLTMYYLV